MFTLPSGEQALAEQTQVMTNCSPFYDFLFYETRQRRGSEGHGPKERKTLTETRKLGKLVTARPPKKALDNFSFLWRGLKSFVL